MRRMAIALVGVLALGGIGAIPAGAARAAATGTIAVDPATDLAPVQTVNVTGTGWPADTTLVSGQCDPATIDTGGCEMSSFTFPKSDDAGAVAYTISLRAEIVTSHGPVDCTVAGACVVLLADPSGDPASGATAPISFAPLAAPHGGSLTVPAAPVTRNTTIHVTASGFVPGALLVFAPCKVEATTPDDCGGPQYTDADGAGSASGIVFSWSTLTLNGPVTVDCTHDGACDDAVWDARDFSTLTTQPLRIAPEVAGTITVTPSTGLHDRDTVTVSGTGWPANQFLDIDQCESPGTIGCPNAIGVHAADDGTFTTPFVVRSRQVQEPSYDCELNDCTISANWAYVGGILAASVPISFDTGAITETSRYTAAQLSAIQGAAATLGMSTARLQRDGSWALAWVLGLTGTKTITPFPNTGSKTVRTDWLPREHGPIVAIASSEGTTLPEFEKTGAIFVAYVLALAPARR